MQLVAAKLKGNAPFSEPDEDPLESYQYKVDDHPRTLRSPILVSEFEQASCSWSSFPQSLAVVLVSMVPPKDGTLSTSPSKEPRPGDLSVINVATNLEVWPNNLDAHLQIPPTLQVKICWAPQGTCSLGGVGVLVCWYSFQYGLDNTPYSINLVS
jgi:hypothetical protein